MTKLKVLQITDKKIIITKKKKVHLKGGGLGNFGRKEGKKCPPPFDA